jgi:hypothetical protein
MSPSFLLKGEIKMVSISSIEQGFANYLDTELMTKLPQNGFQKVIAGTVISLTIRKSGAIISSLKDNSFVKMLEVMDEDGNVDIDTLKDEFKKQMPDAGVKVDVPYIGVMTFKKNDVDKLYDYIVSAS